MASKRELPFGLREPYHSSFPNSSWVQEEGCEVFDLDFFSVEQESTIREVGVSDLLAQLPVVIQSRLSEALHLRLVDEQIGRLSSRIGRLEAKAATDSCITTIQTFAPEPYHLVTPIPVTIEKLSDSESFMASFFDANISATGDNPQEAFENLKSFILDMFDSLAAENSEKLGPEPLRQIAVLREFIHASRDK